MVAYEPKYTTLSILNKFCSMTKYAHQERSLLSTISLLPFVKKINVCQLNVCLIVRLYEMCRSAARPHDYSRRLLLSDLFADPCCDVTRRPKGWILSRPRPSSIKFRRRHLAALVIDLQRETGRRFVISFYDDR